MIPILNSLLSPRPRGNGTNTFAYKQKRLPYGSLLLWLSVARCATSKWWVKIQPVKIIGQKHIRVQALTCEIWIRKVS
ncbi:hypothetical protein VCRA2123O74_190062 [Vibrio crassostreae]|nr:hypothetical protein VCRA213O314_590005 [Vibrio crassostreae]CAK3657690.1 hypothetical protein VCRA2123O74_190062 [Vibrio crassostreae]